MKRIFIGLFTAVLLLSACSNDEDQKHEPNAEGGSLMGVITLEGMNENTKAVAPIIPTVAIPKTSWANIEQAQVFLYNDEGEVKYSHIFYPQASNPGFVVRDIAPGTYKLAVVANAKNTTRVGGVNTSIDGGVTFAEFNKYNVQGRKFGETYATSQILMDLKTLDRSELPTEYEKHQSTLPDLPVAPPSEIFTAYYSGIVEVIEDQTTNLTSSPLQLKREVSLMRVRIRVDKDEIPTHDLMNFTDEQNSILIHQNPVGLGLAFKAFGGGIFSEKVSADNRVMIGMKGLNTYRTDAPTDTHKNPGGAANPVILTGDFAYWQEVIVLPNMARSENKLPGDNADTKRKYFVGISAIGKAGHIALDKNDNPITLTQDTPIYWGAYIDGGFSPNVIREVNITIKTGGGIEPPERHAGTLIIEVDAPRDWDTGKTITMDI